MMPVMPMDPATRAAVVAKAMIETAASQSLEPGPATEAAAPMGAQAVGPSSAPELTAGDVMPVPLSTATSAGATVSMAPSAAEMAPAGSSHADSPAGQASAASLPSEPGHGSERVADTAVPVVLGSLHATTIDAPRRHRVEREDHPRRRRRQPGRHDAEPPSPNGEEPEPERDGRATPASPLSWSALCPILTRHAGGLAITELRQGRRVLVVDVSSSDQGPVRLALLWWPPLRAEPVLMACTASVDAGWGWVWSAMAGQHWRLRRDVSPDGAPALFSPDAGPARPFHISLRSPAPRHMGEHLQVRLADPIRFQRHLGHQWTYLALLINLDHEPARTAST